MHKTNAGIHPPLKGARYVNRWMESPATDCTTQTAPSTPVTVAQIFINLKARHCFALKLIYSSICSSRDISKVKHRKEYCGKNTLFEHFPAFNEGWRGALMFAFSGILSCSSIYLTFLEKSEGGRRQNRSLKLETATVTPA